MQRMKQFSKDFLVLTGYLIFSCAAVAAPPKAPRLQNVKTWAFAIGDGMLNGDVAKRFQGYDLVIVDGENVQTAQVAALHQNGALVLSYLSVGTIEQWRWWYKDVKRYRLDYWGDWGEWYADTSKAGYRNTIAMKVAPWLLKKGVDGLFLDNTDMTQDHPKQKSGMAMLVKLLSSLVRAQKRLLFTQNGEDVIGTTQKYYDGWNREDVTWTYNFDTRQYEKQPPQEINEALDALRKIRDAGLLVTATDYVNADNISAESLCIQNACSAGALPFISNLELTRLPASPIVCDE